MTIQTKQTLTCCKVHDLRDKLGNKLNENIAYWADRERVSGMVEHGDFIEIYCDTPIEICETRDVKGLYQKARSGQIVEFTGISSPYEVPERSELSLNTAETKLDDCVNKVIMLLQSKLVIGK